MTKWVYAFGQGNMEGNASMKALLGGKGANLAEMCNLGLPVPPGFTVTTEVCTHYYAHAKQFPVELEAQIATQLQALEKQIDAKFGDPEKPLLVSVRSGARASMPGMMDTILNLGLNDITVQGLAIRTGNERFAYDSYRRFIQMYSGVVLGVEHAVFEEMLELVKNGEGVRHDTELSIQALKELVDRYKELVQREGGVTFPQEVHMQLWGAIRAVFDSWMNARAITYRRLHHIPEQWGTAVNIQAMVFGNMGEDSATGVAFTRDPSTGEKQFFGEYLINAQGEDVVAGIRTPQSITEHGRMKTGSALPSMEKAMPEVYGQLLTMYQTLELHYRDMQDIEFTVQKGKLWLLQTRAGKRAAQAAITIAMDMLDEGLINEDEALMRVSPISLDQLLHPALDTSKPYVVMDRGLPASPGAASGAVVFDAETAQQYAAKAVKCILVRVETSPEDIHGMIAAQGILTSRGGMTSHAAVVARGMGKSCVCGASKLRIDMVSKTLTTGSHTLSEGDIVTINGSTGDVIAGEVATIHPQMSPAFTRLMELADARRTLKIRANAETVTDSKMARHFGAEGIGLCRTEHMFFDSRRIQVVREMILAESLDERKHTLEQLLPMQRNDFVEIFRVMDGFPVTVRLLDPPLHEFLPHSEKDMAEFATAADIPIGQVRFRCEQLHEFNPMLGHRGCRLGISYPEIYEMQVRAVFEAAIEVKTTSKITVVPEIMIPLVMDARELAHVRLLVEQTAKQVMQEKAVTIDYQIGTMIELPRAALRAESIAEHAAFFSFGTNDLTQTTMGISRDDAGSFLMHYVAKQVMEHDPFVVLDEEGVGELIQLAVERGRRGRPHLKIGICGEHGGHPAAVAFCHKLGMDYVSCSPFRVPIARLAAAQATIAQKHEPDA
jgi:pyruvate,orthophosphate dikinase